MKSRLKGDTVFALALAGVALVVFVACAYAAGFVQSAVSFSQHCEGASFYAIKPNRGMWNKRWKRFVHPPQSGNYGDVSCCDSNNGAVA